MKLHTRWKRVYNPIIGIRFFDHGDLGLGFFTIEKLWICEEYCKGAQRYDGSKWTNWFVVKKMQVRTNTGLVYKLPFCPWMKAVDDRGKELKDYYNENSFMLSKSKKSVKW